MDEMERAHRNDYEYEKKLREARIAIRAVIDTGKPGRGPTQALENMESLLTAEMDHIVARWN
jgi:hypothetical protein